MARVSRSLSVCVLLGLAGIGPLASPAGAGPEGQMVLAQTISIAARWFDPAEAEGIITPYIFYYALHDALVKPLPGNPLTPCLAESWSASADGLIGLAALEHGQARRLVGDAPDDHRLDVGHLAPVLLVRLQHQLVRQVVVDGKPGVLDQARSVDDLLHRGAVVDHARHRVEGGFRRR